MSPVSRLSDLVGQVRFFELYKHRRAECKLRKAGQPLPATLDLWLDDWRY